jgi:hypothetical protein
MIVIWWTGRGYLTAVILLLTLCAFGVLVQATSPERLDHPWFWGFAFIMAGCINWPIGARLNRRRGFAPPSWRRRLTYRARNRIFWLPMEVWTVPFVVGGLAAVLYGVAQ